VHKDPFAVSMTEKTRVARVLLFEDPSGSRRGLNHLGKPNSPIRHCADFDPTQHARGSIADDAPCPSIQDVQCFDCLMPPTTRSTGHRCSPLDGYRLKLTN
jgi:hypothetical protein